MTMSWTVCARPNLEAGPPFVSDHTSLRALQRESQPRRRRAELAKDAGVYQLCFRIPVCLT